MTTHKITWRDSGLEPKEKPDPRFPNGKDIPCLGTGPCCKVELPYPAKRIGAYIIECEACGCRYGVTTAGRPDDPRSVMMSCKLPLQTH